MESTDTSVFGSLRFRVSLLAVAAILLLVGVHGGAAPLPDRAAGKEPAVAAIPQREARCMDGSLLKTRILDEKLTLKTPYGKLVIPLAKITEIEFATRVPADLSKRIASAIGQLGSDDARKRDAATEELSRLQAKAYHALLQVEEDKDLEVRRRAKDLLKKIRDIVPVADLALRAHDVVHTADSKITGEIEATSFRVHTEVFGEGSLKLSAVRAIHLTAQEGKPGAALSGLPPRPVPVALPVFVPAGGR
jgi:hypothetical protein